MIKRKGEFVYKMEIVYVFFQVNFIPFKSNPRPKNVFFSPRNSQFLYPQSYPYLETIAKKSVKKIEFLQITTVQETIFCRLNWDKKNYTNKWE